MPNRAFTNETFYLSAPDRLGVVQYACYACDPPMYSSIANADDDLPGVLMFLCAACVCVILRIRGECVR